MRFARSHLVLTLLVPVLLALVAGCSAGWTALNRAPLKADLTEVLEPWLGRVSLTDCRMIGSTRSGYCTLELDRAGARALSEGLGLMQGTVDLEDLAAIPPAAAEGKVGCLTAEALGPLEGLAFYWIGNRPERLALQGGGQLEYLLLILSESTGMACVQASYAYG